MLSAVTLALFVLAFLLLLWRIVLYHWGRRAIYKFSISVPGPSPTLPIIGNGLALGTNLTSFLDNAEKLFKKYPSGFRLWMGPTLCYCILSPEDLSTVLYSAKSSQKGVMYKYTEPSFGEGIMTSSGLRWRAHRRMVNKAMLPSILDGYVEAFSLKSRIMVEKLKEEVGGLKFNLFSYVGRCATDLVCETILGIKTNAQNKQNEEFEFHITMILKITGIRTLRPWLYNDFIFNHSKHGKQQEKSKKIVYEFLNTVIDEKIEAHKANLGSGRLSTLENLIEIGDEANELTKKDLLDEMLSLFNAAQDPIASLTCVTCLMLAMKQDVQDKVHQELKGIFGESDRPVESEDLTKMNYLEMVIKESLRLFPPILLYRSVLQDLKLGNVVIPAGCDIIFSPFFTNRLEEYWGPNPKIFDPDRFLPENIASRPPLAYIPFSAGLRSCAGEKFGVLAAKTLVAEVLRKYVLFTDQKESSIKLIGALVPRPVGGFRIQIKNRT